MKLIDIPLADILTKIKQSNDYELNEMIKAIVARHDEVFPDWEVMFLSLPRNDPQARRNALESTFNFLRSHEK